MGRHEPISRFLAKKTGSSLKVNRGFGVDKSNSRRRGGKASHLFSWARVQSHRLSFVSQTAPILYSAELKKRGSLVHTKKRPEYQKRKDCPANCRKGGRNLNGELMHSWTLSTQVGEKFADEIHLQYIYRSKHPCFWPCLLCLLPGHLLSMRFQMDLCGRPTVTRGPAKDMKR